MSRQEREQLDENTILGHIEEVVEKTRPENIKEFGMEIEQARAEVEEIINAMLNELKKINPEKYTDSKLNEMRTAINKRIENNFPESSTEITPGTSSDTSSDDGRVSPITLSEAIKTSSENSSGRVSPMNFPDKGDDSASSSSPKKKGVKFQQTLEGEIVPGIHAFEVDVLRAKPVAPLKSRINPELLVDEKDRVFELRTALKEQARRMVEAIYNEDALKKCKVNEDTKRRVSEEALEAINSKLDEYYTGGFGNGDRFDKEFMIPALEKKAQKVVSQLVEDMSLDDNAQVNEIKTKALAQAQFITGNDQTAGKIVNDALYKKAQDVVSELVDGISYENYTQAQETKQNALGLAKFITGNDQTAGKIVNDALYEKAQDVVSELVDSMRIPAEGNEVMTAEFVEQCESKAKRAAYILTSDEREADEIVRSNLLPYIECKDDFKYCHQADQWANLVQKKFDEQSYRSEWYQALSLQSNTSKTNQMLAYLDWQKARVEYRIALYDIRSKNDPTDKTAREKKVIAKNLRSHIDQMRLACGAAAATISTGKQDLRLSGNKFPTSKNGELGAIRKDLLKTVFKKDRMNDLKYCKKPADTNKLFTTLLNLREAEHQYHLAKTPETKLAKIKCDLEYRQAFYSIRCEERDKKGNPKDKKAAAKLKETKSLIEFVDAAIKAKKNDLPVIEATLTTSLDAKQGKLGKLRDELKTFRDTYQEEKLAEKETAFKSAKEKYKNTPAENFNDKLIAKLTMLKAELELKETLYTGRNNTSKTFYHGFFSRKEEKSPDKKLTAAQDLKEYVSDVLKKIESQKDNKGALSIPENMSEPLKDVPGQDTLNRIRREINAEVSKLTTTVAPTPPPSPSN